MGSIFNQKSVDIGLILVKKILRGGSHFTKFEEKNVKLTIFEVEKPLEMGLNLQKFRKKNPVYSASFLSEKNP